MAPEKDPEEHTQDEIRRDAKQEPDDPVTQREELELDLMEEGKSEEGEDIGEQLD